jgi:hypothetical protein
VVGFLSSVSRVAAVGRGPDADHVDRGPEGRGPGDRERGGMSARMFILTLAYSRGLRPIDAPGLYVMLELIERGLP